MAGYDYCTSHRHEKAVLWRFAGMDRESKPLVYDPVEIDVRWEETREDVLNPLSGQMVTKSANVVVDQEIALGSIMWLGELADVPATGDFRQVIEYKQTPNYDNTLVRRTVGLMRFRNTLPASKAGTGTGP